MDLYKTLFRIFPDFLVPIPPLGLLDGATAFALKDYVIGDKILEFNLFNKQIIITLKNEPGKHSM